MSPKTTIATAGNTIIPAYLALLQKGYSISCESRAGAAKELWVAEDASTRFIAEDPLLLLGLVGLYEIRGERWPATDSEIEEFLAKFS
jgi:hypothetical protein